MISIGAAASNPTRPLIPTRVSPTWVSLPIAQAAPISSILRMAAIREIFSPFTPTMRDIERFLENSQQKVSGKVFIRLRPYHFDLIGIESEHDLMNSGFAEYGEMNKAWTADDVKGFTKILSMPLRIYNVVNGL